MQNHYNLLYREEEREMIPLCQSEGIGIIPWSPLAVAGWPADGEPKVRSAMRPISSGKACTLRRKKLTKQLSTALGVSQNSEEFPALRYSCVDAKQSGDYSSNWSALRNHITYLTPEEIASLGACRTYNVCQKLTS